MNKLLISFLLSACLISRISAKQTTPADSPTPAPTTGMAMPAFVTAANSGAAGMEKTGPTVCPTVWSNEGTLCNGGSLVTFDKADVAQGRASVERIALSSIVIPKASVKVTGPKNQMGMRSRLLKKTSSSRDITLNAVKPISTEQGKIEESMANSSKVCWQHFEQVRNATLCYVCSRENIKYFARQKAMITKQDCNKMLDACVPFFNQATKYIKDTDNSKIKLKTTQNLHTKMLGFMTKSTIPELLSAYNTTNKSEEISTKLCTRLYTIHKEPLVTPFSKLVEELALDKALKGRLLSENDFVLTENPFAGDVAVQKGTDNMFTSFDGATGTTTDFENSHYRSMNLSLAFP